MFAKERVLISLISCVLALFVTLLCINGISLSERWYQSDFSRLGVYERFGEEADKVNTEVLLYLKGEGNLTTSFFSAREKSHLADVKGVFDWTIGLSGALVVLLALLGVMLQKMDRERFLRNVGEGFLLCGIIGISVLGLIAFASVLQFNSSFLAFHTMFFEEGTYLFDPMSENIVNLYPQELFFAFSLRIAFFAIAVFLGLMGLGAYLRRERPSKNNKLFKRKKKR